MRGRREERSKDEQMERNWNGSRGTRNKNKGKCIRRGEIRQRKLMRLIR